MTVMTKEMMVGAMILAGDKEFVPRSAVRRMVSIITLSQVAIHTIPILVMISALVTATLTIPALAAAAAAVVEA